MALLYGRPLQGSASSLGTRVAGNAPRNDASTGVQRACNQCLTSVAPVFNLYTSEPTYYKWKSQLAVMTVSQLSQRRQLQDENAKPKRIYADLVLMHYARKDVADRQL